jgi:putative addiction module component (TIGR02574 family)
MIEASLVHKGNQMSPTPTAAEVIKVALQMPAGDRAEIVNALLLTLDENDSTAPVELDPAWSDEIKRRIDEIDSGAVQTVSSDQVWERIGGRISDES